MIYQHGSNSQNWHSIYDTYRIAARSKMLGFGFGLFSNTFKRMPLYSVFFRSVCIIHLLNSWSFKLKWYVNSGSKFAFNLAQSFLHKLHINLLLSALPRVFRALLITDLCWLWIFYSNQYQTNTIIIWRYNNMIRWKIRLSCCLNSPSWAAVQRQETTKLF